MDIAQYKTTDQYLASFLLNEDANFVGGTRLGPKTVEFRFVADRTLHALLRAYWSNQLVSLVPSRLFAAYRFLKRRSPLRP